MSEPQRPAIWHVRFRSPTLRPRKGSANGRNGGQYKAPKSVPKGAKSLTVPAGESFERALVSPVGFKSLSITKRTEFAEIL
jgi:hypothetical protein